jgi:hypothetical protein
MYRYLVPQVVLAVRHEGRHRTSQPALGHELIDLLPGRAQRGPLEGRVRRKSLPHPVDGQLLIVRAGQYRELSVGERLIGNAFTAGILAAVVSWLHGDHAVTARMHDVAPFGGDIGRWLA